MSIRRTTATALTLAAFLALALGTNDAAIAQPHGPNGPMGGPSEPELAAAVLDPGQEPGQVVVTLVAGALDKPLAGVDIVLSGTSQSVVRTDAEGKAVFAKLARSEYEVTAKVVGAQVRSERFALPETGGVSIVLTTVAIGPGRGGRPSTRFMSGRARPEANDASGTLTVRAVRGEMEQSEFGGLVAEIPEGAQIHLVGMHADGSMTVETKVATAENEGRVVFENLARDNSIAYYAMSVFERAGGSDRLMTTGLDLPPQIGSRMMFAGAKSNSAAVGIDDLEQLSGTDAEMPEAGTVLVRMFAEDSQSSYLQHTSKVELLQIGATAAPLSANVGDAPPSASSVLGRSGPMKAAEGTEPGQVSIYTVRPSADSAIPGVKIRIESESTPSGAAAPDEGLERATNAQGLAFFPELVVGKSYVAVATLYGKEVRSEAFTPKADEAQSQAFAFEWPEQTIREARFEGVAQGVDKIYIARVFSEGRQFLSLPFQLTRDKGAAVGIYMYPELLFSMHGGGELDDTRLWFQTRISLANPGIAPLRLDAKGLIIPLPKGFLGASVAEEMTSRVGVESKKGFLWRGAVPPGQRDFVATFALPVEGGKVTFDMELPYGLRAGRIVLEDLIGMELRTPAGAEVKQSTQPNGRKFIEMPNISIMPQQRLVFGISGLPQYSVWERRVRIGVGLMALALIGWVLFAVFLGSRRSEDVDPALVALETTREKLMAELVALETERRHEREADKPYQKKRERLNSRLAEVYRQIDDHKTSMRNSN